MLGKKFIPPQNLPSNNNDLNTELKQLIQIVKSQITNIDYREIDFRYVGLDELHLETYEIVLDDEIQENVDQIIKILADRGNNDVAQSWYFQIDSEGQNYFNRLHFNNGLPYELRGTGFGFKIYKSFITIKGYASSNSSNSSDDARRVWIKMVQESDFECVLNDKVVLILNKKLHNKLQITKQFIEFYTIHLNSKNTVISETLLNEIKTYIPAALGGESHEQHDIQQYPTANNDLKIGDTVFVFDVDNNVITHNEALTQKLGATNWKKGTNDLVDYDAVTIKNIIFNQGENVALCYSPRTKKEYLINVEGLEKEHENTLEMS